MNRYFTYFILLGNIITLSYYGMADALSIMYSSPLEQQNFGSFFLMMSMIVITIGMFFQWVVPVKMSMIRIDIYGPALVMLSAVIVGNIYGHSLKTDQFLYYFILTHVITMYTSLAAGRQLTTLFKIGSFGLHEVVLGIMAIIFGSALAYSAHYFIFEHRYFAGIWNIYVALFLAILAICWSSNIFNRAILARAA